MLKLIIAAFSTGKTTEWYNNIYVKSGSISVFLRLDYFRQVFPYFLGHIMKEHEKPYRYIYTTLWFNISLPFLYRAQGNQNRNLLLFDSKIEQNSISNRLYYILQFRTVISCIIKSISNFLTALMDSLGPLTENTLFSASYNKSGFFSTKILFLFNFNLKFRIRIKFRI